MSEIDRVRVRVAVGVRTNFWLKRGENKKVKVGVRKWKVRM